MTLCSCVLVGPGPGYQAAARRGLLPVVSRKPSPAVRPVGEIGCQTAVFATKGDHRPGSHAGRPAHRAASGSGHTSSTERGERSRRRTGHTSNSRRPGAAGRRGAARAMRSVVTTTRRVLPGNFGRAAVSWRDGRSCILRSWHDVYGALTPVVQNGTVRTRSRRMPQTRRTVPFSLRGTQPVIGVRGCRIGTFHPDGHDR
jgi:hypothetical protein